MSAWAVAFVMASVSIALWLVTPSTSVLDKVALVGGEGSERVEQQASRGRGRVDARVPDGDEPDARVLQLVEDLEEVLQASAEAVEFPDHHEV